MIDPVVTRWVAAAHCGVAGRIDIRRGSGPPGDDARAAARFGRSTRRSRPAVPDLARSAPPAQAVGGRRTDANRTSTVVTIPPSRRRPSSRPMRDDAWVHAEQPQPSGQRQHGVPVRTLRQIAARAVGVNDASAQRLASVRPRPHGRLRVSRAVPSVAVRHARAGDLPAPRVSQVAVWRENVNDFVVRIAGRRASLDSASSVPRHGRAGRQVRPPHVGNEVS